MYRKCLNSNKSLLRHFSLESCFMFGQMTDMACFVYNMKITYCENEVLHIIHQKTISYQFIRIPIIFFLSIPHAQAHFMSFTRNGDNSTKY